MGSRRNRRRPPEAVLPESDIEFGCASLPVLGKNAP